MNAAILQMLSGYDCRTATDYENALKEIIQEVTLLALWRAKFFEHAAFYGGSALRILYGLERFSEDLDFSLLIPNESFALAAYLRAVTDELTAFGFEATVEMKAKQIKSPVESAFIKAGTLLHLLKVAIPERVAGRVPRTRVMSVKIEIDTDPPPGFHTEVKTLLQPIPFAVLCYSPPDLFAGKLHAILHRAWKSRVKGRDYYDLVWYIGQGVPCRLSHLEQRLRQSGGWTDSDPLTEERLKQALADKFETLDVSAARRDVSPFLRDLDSTALWSPDFFKSLLPRLQIV